MSESLDNTKAAATEEQVLPATAHSASSVDEKRQDGGIILIPQPSADPNDPLVSETQMTTRTPPTPTAEDPFPIL